MSTVYSSHSSLVYTRYTVYIVNNNVGDKSVPVHASMHGITRFCTILGSELKQLRTTYHTYHSYHSYDINRGMFFIDIIR